MPAEGTSGSCNASGAQLTKTPKPHACKGLHLLKESGPFLSSCTQHQVEWGCPLFPNAQRHGANSKAVRHIDTGASKIPTFIHNQARACPLHH